MSRKARPMRPMKISSIRSGREAARAYADVVPLDGLSDGQKLKVYDLLREAHTSIKAIWERELLEDANDEQDRVLDAVDMVLYMAEGIFAKMSD